MEGAPRRRALRSDAAANREALGLTAARVVRERGPAVPLAEVAAEAGVGIGTLYRHFPDRDALLAALRRRAGEVLLDEARRAGARVDAGTAPREAIEGFVEAVLERRAELAMPLLAATEAVSAVLEPVVARGVADGTLRADAATTDVVVVAALLAAPFAPTTGWVAVARRHAAIVLDGLSADRP